MIKSLIFSVLLLLITSQSALSQKTSDCSKPLTYENKHQIDPKPLILSRIVGVVKDEQGVPIPYVCLAVFSKDGQKLLFQSISSQKGKFIFKLLPPGDYRIIAKYDPFCTANIPVKIIARKLKDKYKHRKMVVYLKPTGVDNCSYGSYYQPS